MTLMSVCESDVEGIAGWGKRNPQPLFCFIAIYICSPSLSSPTFCEHGWNSVPPTASCVSREALGQSASQSTAELHCLRDNAWLTWSTSEPDILLSVHHNTTTQTDMAGPLISRAGLTDLLCAHCNGCMLSLRIQWLETQIYSVLSFRCFATNIRL